MQSLGKRLLNARKQQQLTQEQLAAYMNVTRSTISNWERDICEPDFEALQQLSAVLGSDFFISFNENTVVQEENSRKITLNACELSIIEVISPANACKFSEITVDCSVNCVDQYGNALTFRLFAPFCIAKADE